MKRRDLEAKMRAAGCTPDANSSGRGPHDKWRCGCGNHSANIPRHAELSPGVIDNTIKRLSCLPEGWWK